MSRRIGILLRIDFKKHKIFINNEWLLFKSALQITNEMLGKMIIYHLSEQKEVFQVEETEQKLKEMKGKIQSLNRSIPRISMHVKGRLVHFYIPESINRFVQDQFEPGFFLQFFYHEDEMILDDTYYYVIALFKEEALSITTLPRSISKDLRNKLEAVLDTRYHVFLDLEFSMNGYEYRNKKFLPEIIQAGLVIVDINNEIIEKFSSYIKPTVFPNITSRTQEFLKINKAIVDNGITYLQFYNYIRDIQARYTPLFIVWGVSDGFILNSSCTLNHVQPLFEPNQLIDLQQIHRHYYQIGQDIGLYNALKSYGFLTGIQIHDAMVDAIILHHIFSQFKSTIEGNHQFPFKQNYQDIMENR